MYVEHTDLNKRLFGSELVSKLCQHKKEPFQCHLTGTITVETDMHIVHLSCIQTPVQTHAYTCDVGVCMCCPHQWFTAPQ